MKNYSKKMNQLSQPAGGTSRGLSQGSSKSLSYRASQPSSQSPPTAASPIPQRKQMAGM